MKTKKEENELFTILLVHGPNLNLLGEREPEVYGRQTLADIVSEVTAEAHSLGVDICAFQSNHEGTIIDFLHKYRKEADGVIINPGALTHYSYALRDAISAINKPTVEVHLSDIHKREDFRRVSVIKDVCIAQISGMGVEGYVSALHKLMAEIQN